MRRWKNKTYIFVLSIFFLLVFSFFITSCGKSKQKTEQDTSIEYYTCGMHPSVRISQEEYDKGQKNCPICNMNLIPVKKTQNNKKAEMENVTRSGETNKPGTVNRVTVPVEQLKRADIQSEVVVKRTLCKTIRTVGQIAYDPNMLVAQEELISSLEAMDEIREGADPEIIERAQSLIDSSKRKLRLLGLSNDQIELLSEKRQAQEGLVLPEDKMWVYGDIYEYEIGWVSSGRRVTATSESFPGEKFYGTIAAMDPVVNPKTRSVRFRAEIDNPGLKLKPQMYVDVEIQGICINEAGENRVPAVPKEAVIDTGQRKIVWVDMGDGIFEGREVETGMEGVSTIDGDGRAFYPVLSGISENEKVVTKGNFLIDSQSQITGVASSAYGGTLNGDKNESRPMVHHH